MAMKKVTFTLDDSTLRKLETTAGRLQKAKSDVVREAIADYAERAGRLSEGERRRLLLALDHGLTAIAPRPASEVASEIEDVSKARRAGGRGAR